MCKARITRTVKFKRAMILAERLGKNLIQKNLMGNALFLCWLINRTEAKHRLLVILLLIISPYEKVRSTGFSCKVTLKSAENDVKQKIS